MNPELFTLAASEPPLEWKIRVARMALAEAECISEADAALARRELASLEAEQLRRIQSKESHE